MTEDWPAVATPGTVPKARHADLAEGGAGSLDDELWTARPALTVIRDYARARRAAPWAVLGVALARLGCAVPPFVVLPKLVGGHGSLNLFVGLIGPPGAGKGAAQRAGADVLDVGHVEAAGVGSGEGLAHLYARRTKEGLDRHATAMLLDVAEVDTLAAVADRRGATLLPELRRAWSGEALGFSYADPNKRLPIAAHSYRLTMIVGIQPARATGLFNDADGGTPQRFLWVPATDPDAPEQPPPEPKSLTWKAPTWPMADMEGRVVLDVCDEARQAIDAARLATLRGKGAALDAHAPLARLKVAAVLGLLDERTGVSAEDWRLAGIIAAKSDQTREGVVAAMNRQAREQNRRRGELDGERQVVANARIEEDAIRRVCRFIKRKLTEAGGEMEHTPLRKALPSRDRHYFDLSVVRLCDAGQVKVDDIDGCARRYRLTEVRP
ncbi:hypothetical protein HDA40_003432 [Hamadaea flava]|uniref:YfjI family protein n=1 Tax=Hamadaea flava TaxID=1742688 RepID=A0ABV8LMB0_9ACTN|nr:YfjI family protein [Hamadaea flava]MCP2324925.1 hypothetical protein [Hamadaea flava]